VTAELLQHKLFPDTRSRPRTLSGASAPGATSPRTAQTLTEMSGMAIAGGSFAFTVASKRAISVCETQPRSGLSFAARVLLQRCMAPTSPRHCLAPLLAELRCRSSITPPASQR